MATGLDPLVPEHVRQAAIDAGAEAFRTCPHGAPSAVGEYIVNAALPVIAEHYQARVDELVADRDVARAEIEWLLPALAAKDIESHSRLGQAKDAHAERDAALARAAALRDAIEPIRQWATTVHGGTKAPVDVWPGLAAAFAAVPSGKQAD